MFKKVLLAALLAPVLAYGGSPGTDLSVQIVPATSPTPPPPSPTPPPPAANPTPPAGAQAAGFTTLALNMDFTGATPSSYNGKTFNINDVSGDSTAWLYCYNGVSNNPTNPIWWLAPSWGNAAPCNRVSIINDGGTNALDIQYQPTDGSSLGVGATEIATWTVNEPSNTGHSFPMGGGYFEIEYRTPDASFTATGSNQSLVNDIWAWPPSGYDTEWDFIELQHNPVYAYSACHSGDNCQTFPAWGYGISYDQYHIFASRFTTDGTNMVDCAYLDGTFQSCNGGNGAFQTSTGTSEERVFFRMTLGPQTTSGYSGNPPLNNMDMYVAHVRFWTCSSWLTTPCLSTVLTGAP